MVIFNDLRVAEDKSCLVVECEIEDISGYDGLYIDTVHIEYYKNVTSDGVPSDKAICVFSDDEEQAHARTVRCELKLSDISVDTFGTDKFDGGLFFVTVKCDGTPTNPAELASYGCGADRMVDTGVIVDWETVYRNGMSYVNSLADDCVDKCNPPLGFGNFILYWYALRLAINTCDWPLVRDLWDRFSGSLGGIRSKGSSMSGCGCRG